MLLSLNRSCWRRLSWLAGLSGSVSIEGDLENKAGDWRLTEGQSFVDPPQVWSEYVQARGQISGLRLRVERRLAEIRALRANKTPPVNFRPV